MTVMLLRMEIVVLVWCFSLIEGFRAEGGAVVEMVFEHVDVDSL